MIHYAIIALKSSKESDNVLRMEHFLIGEHLFEVCESIILYAIEIDSLQKFSPEKSLRRKAVLGCYNKSNKVLPLISPDD